MSFETCGARVTLRSDVEAATEPCRGEILEATRFLRNLLASLTSEARESADARDEK
jgi:hypothetical protein